MPVLSTLSCLISARLDSVCAEFSSQEDIYVRVGFACGKVIARMSGSRFRLYSPAMNAASRCEYICQRGHVCGPMSSPTVEPCEILELKGLGKVNVTRLPVGEVNSSDVLALIVP